MIRRTINEFYINKKRIPTVKAVLKVLQEIINYKGQASSLLKVFKKLGFLWKKMRDNRRVLTEKQKIRSARVLFLRAIMKYRQKGRPIVYSDETYIHSSHTLTSAWTNDNPTSKGQRLIIVHAESVKEYYSRRKTYLQVQSKNWYYHREMNGNNYKKWINEKLKSNLPKKSVLVIDNASYHNVIRDISTSSARKKDMEDCLLKYKMSFSSHMLKTELYELIKIHKPRQKKYALDEILEVDGHIVLRLPPYHPNLNAIEKIWTNPKYFVGSHNTTFKLDDVRQLC